MPKTPTAEQWIDKHSTVHEIEKVDPFELGKEMRRYRESRGKSLREVAREMNITPPYLSDCERGFRKLTIEKLKRFIDAC